MPSETQASPSCPRCGYDLTGLDSEGERGTCAECGLSFSWEDLRERLHLPEWYVEKKDSIFGGVRRTASTLWWMLPPRLPWKKLPLEAFAGGFRWRAMIGWLAVLAVIAHLSAGIVVGSEAARKAYEVVGATGTTIAPTPTRYQRWSLVVGDRSPTLEASLAFVYGVVDPVGWFEPLGGRAHAWMTTETAPSGVINMWGPRHPAPWAKNRNGMPVVWITLMASMLAPIVFIVLPVTRRKAKVLPSHIIRLGLLSLFIPALMFVLVMVGWGVELWRASGQNQVGAYVLMLGGVPALCWWWWSGCKQYLRLTSHGVVATSVLAIAFLSGFVVFVGIDPGWFQRLLR